MQFLPYFCCVYTIVKNQISAFCNSLFLEIIFLRFTTIQVYGIIKICNAKHFIRNIIGLVNRQIDLIDSQTTSFATKNLTM